MKKSFLILTLLLIIVEFSFAQTDRGYIGFIRINGTANYYNSIKGNQGYSQNGTLGFSVELGAKQFLEQSNLFLEETMGFVYSKLPSSKPMHYTEKAGYLIWDKGHETGAAASFVLGYQFPMKNNLSVDVFVGPDFRYLFDYKTQVNTSAAKCLHKANLRLKTGVNMNINHLSISLFASPDLLDRGKGTDRYRTVQVGVGIGYYFRWNKVWHYLSTEH